MSKLSPFRKSSSIYAQDYTQHSPYNDPKPYDRTKAARQQPSEYTNKRYYNDNPDNLKLTQKKRPQQLYNIDIDKLLQKNKGLASQNAQLYIMLQERGKIIVALEKKLEEQVRTQMKTLQAIDFEKGKLLAEYNKKFKDYQRKIQELIGEIYRLNEQKNHGNYVRSKQMQMLKDTFNQQQLIHFHSIAQNQASAREMSELQKLKIKNLLENKNHQIQQLNLQFQASNQKLKNQIISLNNQIVHLNHMRKIQLSEQKIMYQNIIQNLTNDYSKEKEIHKLTFGSEIKKLQNIIISLEKKVSQLGDQRKINDIQQSTRELQLLENNAKLQNEMIEVEQFHRKSTFQQARRLKQLNKQQVKAIQVGNEAIITNLKSQNSKLIEIVNTKSIQIDRLLGQLNSLRAQNNIDNTNYQKMIDELKQKMRRMQRDFIEEEQRFKIRYSQLREADIRALKDFYEHQVEILTTDLNEKSQQADRNRALLHQELHAKNQQRKNFQIEVLKLNTRICQLQLLLNEKNSEKKEGMRSIGDKMQMTSDILLRQARQKQRISQINEQQKKNLQKLICNNNKEIQELMTKIDLLNKNHVSQISHKNEQIQILKKAKDDLQIELKKQKFFYDNQLKKKDILLKSNKDNFNNDLQRLKSQHQNQTFGLEKKYTTIINDLQHQIRHYKTLEKNLKTEVNHLQQAKQEQVKHKQNTMEEEKERLSNDKIESIDKLQKYYEAQMAKLRTDISELKKQLGYKQEDLRNMSDKYHKLEQKLQMVIESQQKLKNMENKIVALGQDNNLIKNFAQIIKIRAK